jgi:hypothetical protein
METKSDLRLALNGSFMVDGNFGGSVSGCQWAVEETAEMVGFLISRLQMKHASRVHYICKKSAENYLHTKMNCSPSHWKALLKKWSETIELTSRILTRRKYSPKTRSTFVQGS